MDLVTHGAERKIWVFLIAAVSLLLLWLIVTRGGGWGFEDKGLWDWLELLVIPLALALGAWWFKREERKSELRIAIETDRRNLLATYFDRMENLLLGHRLIEDFEGEAVEIGRARTLHILRSVDGKRKGHVIRFLIDCKALTLENKKRDIYNIIRLSYADLSGVDLQNAHLEFVNCWCANLEDANLRDAHLAYTNLPYAFMRGADLTDADLSHANLENAVVEPSQLRAARKLDGATMPDGTTYEKWLKNGEPDWTEGGMPQEWTSHKSR